MSSPRPRGKRRSKRRERELLLQSANSRAAGEERTPIGMREAICEDRSCSCGRVVDCRCRGGGTFVDVDGQWERRRPTEQQQLTSFQQQLPFLNIPDAAVHLYITADVPSVLIARQHPSWVADRLAPRCADCMKSFSFFLRRHHCRGCGRVMCKTCCAKRRSIVPREWSKTRICESCQSSLVRWRAPLKNRAATTQFRFSPVSKQPLRPRAASISPSVHASSRIVLYVQ